MSSELIRLPIEPPAGVVLFLLLLLLVLRGSQHPLDLFDAIVEHALTRDLGQLALKHLRLCDFRVVLLHDEVPLFAAVRKV